MLCSKELKSTQKHPQFQESYLIFSCIHVSYLYATSLITFPFCLYKSKKTLRLVAPLAFLSTLPQQQQKPRNPKKTTTKTKTFHRALVHYISSNSNHSPHVLSKHSTSLYREHLCLGSPQPTASNISSMIQSVPRNHQLVIYSETVFFPSATALFVEFIPCPCCEL